MSEIRATTISDETGNGPITLTKQQAAKAFITNLRDSSYDDTFNVSSTTNSSTGTNNVNFTNNMGNTSYGISNGTRVITSAWWNVAANRSSTSYFTVYYRYNGSNYDYLSDQFVFGDLA